MGLIQDIAALAPAAEKHIPSARRFSYGLKIPGASPGSNGNGNHRLDVARWLSDRAVEYTIKTFADGRTGYILANCPFDPAHGGSGEVMVAQDADGKLSAKCFHNSCNGRGWKEFKQAIGEPNGDHFDPPMQPRQQTAAQTTGTQDEPQTEEEQPYLTIHPVGELIRSYPRLRSPVISGLLRQGETMNVISSPKVGKSWLVADLALAIVTGRQWLTIYDVQPGKVLILDNELHRETLGYRIKKVADARGIEQAEYDNDLHIVTLRGCLTDIIGLGPRLLERLDAGTYRLIILDALYRAVPVGTDENSNSAIAQVYNAIDAYAMKLDCGFCCVHHTTKGNQASKDVTDVGAGAGSQARAADTHLILRPHIEAGAIVLEAAARSWPPIDPVALRWEWPLWTADTELDPTALKTDRAKRQEADQHADIAEMEKRIVDTFVHFPDGATQRDIRGRVGQGKIFDQAWQSVCNSGQLTECEVTKANRQIYPGFKRVYRDGEKDE